MLGLPRKVVGIDVSDASIEVAEVEPGRALTVRALGRVTLQPGLVERGVIRDVAALSAAIRGVLERALPSPIKTREAAVNLPEEQVYIRRIEVPTSSRSEMLRQASEEMQKIVPFPLDSLVWDAVTISASGGKTTLLIVAVEKAVFLSYQSAIKGAGHAPFAFLPESLALGDAFFHGSPKAPTMVIDLGTVTTAISIFDADGLYGSVNVPVGGETLTAEVAEKFSLPREEADALKRSAGFDPEREQGKVFLVLQKGLQAVSEAAARFRDEYIEAVGAAPGALVLSGGTSALRSLDEYLSSVLGVPARRGEVLGELTVAGLPEKIVGALQETPGLFACAVGLAEYALLRSDKRLSLTSEKRILEAAAEDLGEPIERVSPAPSGRRARRQLPAWATALIVVVWLAGMVGVTIYYLKSSGKKTFAPPPPSSPVAESVQSFNFLLTARFNGAPQNGEVKGNLLISEQSGEKKLTLTEVKTDTSGQAVGTAAQSAIDEAVRLLKLELDLKAKKVLVSQLAAGAIMPDEPVKVEELGLSKPAAGTISDAAAVVKAKLRFSSVSIDEGDLNIASRIAAASSLGGAKEASLYSFGNWLIKPKTFDAEAGTVVLEVTAEGRKEE